MNTFQSMANAAIDDSYARQLAATKPVSSSGLQAAYLNGSLKPGAVYLTDGPPNEVMLHPHMIYGSTQLPPSCQWGGLAVTSSEYASLLVGSSDPANRIKQKHSYRIVWEYVVSKKVDRIKVRMSMFGIYIACGAAIALGLTGVCAAWRFFFWSIIQ